MNKQLMLSLSLAFLLSACGKDTGSKTQPGKEQSGQGGGALTMGADCPLSFPNAGLCGKIDWVVGPSAEEASSFTVKFWKKDAGTAAGPFVEPAGQVGSYIRMTCCGSISFPKVSKVSDGNYSVTKVRFVPGAWEVYVQIKNGDAVEKQFIPVKLGE